MGEYGGMVIVLVMAQGLIFGDLMFAGAVFYTLVMTDRYFLVLEKEFR